MHRRFCLVGLTSGEKSTRHQMHSGRRESVRNAKTFSVSVRCARALLVVSTKARTTRIGFIIFHTKRRTISASDSPFCRRARIATRCQQNTDRLYINEIYGALLGDFQGRLSWTVLRSFERYRALRRKNKRKKKVRLPSLSTTPIGTSRSLFIRGLQFPVKRMEPFVHTNVF